MEALTIQAARLAVRTQHPGWDSSSVENAARGMPDLVEEQAEKVTSERPAGWRY